jgi:hypothetical protein
VLVRLLEDDLGAADVGRQALQWLVDDELHADGGGEVEAHVDAGHDVVEQVRVEDAAEDELHVVALAQVLDVLQAAGGQVVQDDHRVAARQEGVGEVGADEAGSAGDEGAHRPTVREGQPVADHPGLRVSITTVLPVSERAKVTGKSQEALAALDVGRMRALVLALPPAAPLVLLGFSLPTVLLLLLQQYRPGLVLALGLLLSAVLLWALPLRPRDAVLWPRLLLLAGLVPWTAGNLRLFSQTTLVNRDPGLYSVTAQWLLSHTSPWMPLPTALPSTATAGSAGFQFVDGAVAAQGAHLLPGLAAVGGLLAGDRGLLAANVVIGAVALLALYDLAQQLVGARWALVPTAALSVSLPMLAFSRTLLTEPATLALVMAGLAWSYRLARGERRWRAWVLTGTLLGAGALARIDGVLPLLLLLPLLGVLVGALPGPAHRRLGAAAAAGLLVVALGLAEVRLNSPAYWSDLAAQRNVLVLVGIAGAGLAVAVALGLGRWWPRSQAALTGRPVAVALAGVIAAVCLLLVARPLWWTSRREPAYPLIAGLQAREGLPVDTLRQYDELTVQWLAWYIGWPGVLLGMLGLVLLTGLAVRRRDPPSAAVVLVVAGQLMLYGTRASIVPDQVWASRRFLPVVLPGLLVAAAFALVQGHDLVRRRAGRWSVPVAALVAAALLFPPLWTSLPLLGARDLDRQLAETRAQCEVVDGRITGLLPDVRQRLTATVRAFCGVDSFGLTVSGRDALHVARVVAASRGEPVVLLTSDEQALPGLKQAVPIVDIVLQRWQERLSGPPTQVELVPRLTWAVVVRPDGKTEVLAP